MGAFLDCYILHMSFSFISIFLFPFFSFFPFSTSPCALSLSLPLFTPAHSHSLSLLFCVTNQTDLEPRRVSKRFSTSREGFEVRSLKESLLNLKFLDFKTYFWFKPDFDDF